MLILLKSRKNYEIYDIAKMQLAVLRQSMKARIVFEVCRFLITIFFNFPAVKLSFNFVKLHTCLKLFSLLNFFITLT